jgi:hypothetical protein
VYFHNNSGFDALLYLKTLSTVYDISSMVHHDKIISISVHDKGSGHKLFDIRDSMLILPSSLGALCKGFGVDTPKEYSPHYWFDLREDSSRTVEEMLSYSGPKLDYKYYEPKRISREPFKGGAAASRVVCRGRQALRPGGLHSPLGGTRQLLR